MNVLVLHGPNLNLLGERPGDPPDQTLERVDRELRRRAIELGVEIKTLQSNHEGALVDALHAERHWMDAVILNPAALGPTSYALRDALAAVRKPAYEVHLTDIRKGEPWRRKSVLKDVCAGQVVGKGIQSYLIALERLTAADAKARSKGKGRLGRAARAAPVEAARMLAPAGLPAKTLGRRPARAAPTAPELKKTLGKAQKGAPVGGVSPAQSGSLTRALVRQKIAERLSGKLSSAELAAWARGQWQEVQRGAPAESGQRELLEELLQRLLLSALPLGHLSDDQLIDLMTRLEV